MPDLHVNACTSGRFDVSCFDRTPEFTTPERERVAAVATGETLHLRLDDPLARLLQPLKACLRLTQAQPSQHSVLALPGRGDAPYPDCVLGVEGGDLDKSLPSLQSGSDHLEHVAACACNGGPALCSRSPRVAQSGAPYPATAVSDDQDLRPSSGRPIHQQVAGGAEAPGVYGLLPRGGAERPVRAVPGEPQCGTHDSHGRITGTPAKPGMRLWPEAGDLQCCRMPSSLFVEEEAGYW